ncbi:acyltransferase family protein [Enterococcus sp. RIT-PI-f]|uniref:acyltransferase family protein n=1 Tax=Enterococcus sp. RIT-PI-f TaxID=1690244 RepID=UPI0006B95AB4|nr:acyltransferase family protein [Enterococcus sp. RIT-PI-f]KPG68596.1 acyltransferase [Enterococcus sp. RIT-PI-f]
MSQSQRTAYFDNAKFLLMILVVFSHLLQSFIGDHKFYHDLYYFIFTFHMPAFVFLSGYFAKPLTKGSKVTILIKKFLLPYLFFQVFYIVYYWLIGLRETPKIQLLNPQWALWFLLSMFFWQLSLFVFQRLSAKQAIFISIALSLCAGYLPFLNQILTLQRTFVFLPFFIIGFYFPKNDMAFLQKKGMRWLSLTFLPIIYGFIAFFHGMNKYMVFGSKPYEDYLSYPLFGGPLRGVFFLIGLIGIIGFMRIVPREKMFFTKWGKNTLLVYLLQGIFIKGLRALNIMDLNLSLLGFVTLILISVLLTILLASKPIRKAYGRFENGLSFVLPGLLAVLLFM